MAEQQFESGQIETVWYLIGKRSDGTPKLKRANFDVLYWAPVSGGFVDTWIVPVGTELVSGPDLNDAPRSDASDAIDVGQEFGYHNGRRHIIEQHQADGSDDLFGVQSFGYF